MPDETEREDVFLPVEDFQFFHRIYAVQTWTKSPKDCISGYFALSNLRFLCLADGAQHHKIVQQRS